MNLFRAISEPMPVTPLNLFADAIKEIIEAFADAIIGSILNILAHGTKQFLFAPSPGEINGLTNLYTDSIWLFFSILSVTSLVFALNMMIFPDSSETDWRRLGSRVAAGLVLLLGLRYGYVLLWELVNLIGRWYFPNTFDFQFVGTSLENLIGSSLGILGAFFLILGFSTTILGIMLMFWVALAMRAVLLYTIFGLIPLFVALWIVDTGPMKYGKMITELAAKIAAFLFILGILIPAIFGVTNAVISSGEVDTGGSPSIAGPEQPEVEMTCGEKTTNCDRAVGGSSSDGEVSGGKFSSKADSGSGTLPLLKMFTALAAPALAIALMGMVTRVMSLSGKNTVQKYAKSTGASQAAGATGGPTGDSEAFSITKTDDGDLVWKDREQEMGGVVDSDGETSTFDLESPSDTQTMDEEVDDMSFSEAVQDQAGSAAGKVDSTLDEKFDSYGSAKDTVGGMKSKAGDMKKSAGEKWEGIKGNRQNPHTEGWSKKSISQRAASTVSRTARRGASIAKETGKYLGHVAVTEDDPIYAVGLAGKKLANSRFAESVKSRSVADTPTSDDLTMHDKRVKESMKDFEGPEPADDARGAGLGNPTGEDVDVPRGYQQGLDTPQPHGAEEDKYRYATGKVNAREPFEPDSKTSSSQGEPTEKTQTKAVDDLSNWEWGSDE